METWSCLVYTVLDFVPKLPGLYSIRFCSKVVVDLEQTFYVNYVKYF